MIFKNESRIDHSGIRNNKGKFALIVIYIVIVFAGPLVYFTPFAQHTLENAAQSAVPKDLDKFFRQYLAFLRQGRLSGANALLEREGGGSVSTTSNEIALASYLASTTDQMEVVGAHWKTAWDGRNSTTTYDVVYQIPNNDPVNKYVLAEIVAQNSPSGTQIVTVNVGDESHSVAKFDFGTEAPYFLLSLVIPLFVAYTALRYVRNAESPGWVLFLVILLLSAYVGIAPEGANLSFGVNGFMSQGGVYGSWTFALPIPLGAIYYYFVRKRYEVVHQRSV